MNSHLLYRLAAFAVIPGLSAASLAGPEWGETADAGNTKDTAQTPEGVGNLGRITGRLEGNAVALGLPDFQDAYFIFVNDPENFRARTVMPEIQPFDTQLFLFGAADALGLLANDDGPMNAPFSLLLPVADDGTAAVTQPGLYLLAISGVPSRPVSDSGLIFVFDEPDEISSPDGPGGAQPLIGWTGPGQIGNYVIEFESVSFPGCAGDVNADGVVNLVDLNIVLEFFGTFSISGDANNDGGVNLEDVNVVLANFGTMCPS